MKHNILNEREYGFSGICSASSLASGLLVTYLMFLKWDIFVRYNQRRNWNVQFFIKALTKFKRHNRTSINIFKSLQKQPTEVLWKKRYSVRKGVLRNFAKITWKHLCQSQSPVQLHATAHSLSKQPSRKRESHIKNPPSTGKFPFRFKL